MPLVLIDCPGGHYWHDWLEHVEKQLLKRGLISPNDFSLFTITDQLDEACNAIAQFYRVFHSCRYIGNRLVIRLNTDISEAAVEELNHDFGDIFSTLWNYPGCLNVRSPVWFTISTLKGTGDEKERPSYRSFQQGGQGDSRSYRDKQLQAK